jgi:hypothetical protein
VNISSTAQILSRLGSHIVVVDNGTHSQTSSPAVSPSTASSSIRESSAALSPSMWSRSCSRPPLPPAWGSRQPPMGRAHLA